MTVGTFFFLLLLTQFFSCYLKLLTATATARYTKEGTPKTTHPGQQGHIPPPPPKYHVGWFFFCTFNYCASPSSIFCMWEGVFYVLDKKFAHTPCAVHEGLIFILCVQLYYADSMWLI